MTTLQMIGRYQVLAELGRGGMATVYRAVDPQVGREVAIKVLPRELLHDQEFRARFRREAETLSRLAHPAIVPVYDVGEHDGQPYLVMRLMVGGSLADRLPQGPLSLAETARIIGELAPALDHAHAAGIIHRDLKPANILFDQRDRPYLADFGIARLSDSTVTLTGGGSIGTPDYMAPEITRPGGLTPLIDIYALGVTVFQMLTGRLPYQADTPMGVMVAHITEPMPDLCLVRPELPMAAQACMARALAKSPASRHQSAGALAADLAALRDGGAFTGATMRVAQPDLQRSRRAAPQAQRRRLMLGGAGAALCAIGVLLAIFAIKPQRSASATLSAQIGRVSPTAQPLAAPAVPQPPISAASVSADKMLIQLEYHVEAATYSPALDRIVFIGSNPDRLYIYDPVNGDSMLIGLAGRPTGLALSPDGAFAAVAMAQQVAYVDLARGELAGLFDVSGPIDGVAVGMPATIYTFSRDGGRVRMLEIDTATGRERVTSMEPSPGGVRYQVLANGQGMYGITDDNPPGLEKIDLSGFHAKYSAASPYDGQHDIGADLWLSNDSQRLFTSCGTVFSTTDDRVQDMRYRATLPDITSIRSLYHVVETDKLLVIPGGDSTGCRGAPADARDDYVMVYNYKNLAHVNSYSLPPLSLDGAAYTVRGRYVFASTSGFKYYVVVQARSSSGLARDFGVLTIDLGAK